MTTTSQTSSVPCSMIGGAPVADPLFARHESTVDFLLASAGRVPLLSAEEEQQLACRIQAGDQDAKRRFIEANLRLVAHLAKDYLGAGLPFEDLFQEGCLGLMRAVEKYDPEQGRFSTYATYWIKQRILRALENTARTIRLPIHVHGQLRQIERATDVLSMAQGAEPTLEQIAEHTGFSAERIMHLALLDQRPVSLHKPITGTCDMQLADTIADPSNLETDELISRQSQQQALPALIAQVLQCLTSRERQVLILRFGLDGTGVQRDLAEVGRMIGLSRERIRQLEGRALEKLRRPEHAPALHAFMAERLAS